MKRLLRYLEGQRLNATLMILVATGNAICQTGGWLLVRNAIDNGISAGNERYLTIIVVIYLVVAAIGWALQAVLIRGLAGIGQRVVLRLRRDLFDHLTGLSLRYFSQQKAGWIIARLTSDVDAVSDVLSAGMPTLVANVILLPAAIAALLIADWRLGLVVFAVVPPALVLTRWFQRTSHVALVETRNRIGAVTAQIAESVSGMAVIQAYNRERNFQAEFDGLNVANREQNVYTQKIFSIFFPSIEWLGALATVGVLYTGSKLLCVRLADDRHADHRAVSPPARVPAVAGALRRVRAAPVRRRRDGQDRDDPRRAAGGAGSRRARTSSRGSTARSRSTTSSSRTAPSRCCTASTSPFPPAAASRSSASPAAASRRSRGSSAASTTRTEARCASTAPTSAT